MKELDHMAVCDRAMKQICGDGAFLTVRLGEEVNTMTIGWATIGYVWGRPIMVVAVRLSRHTFGLIEKAPDFTVSIPDGSHSDELAFCGSNSGADVNKFEECGLTMLDAQKVSSPILEMKGIHYECSTVFKSAMDPKNMSAKLNDYYPAKDYHTMYYGEIVSCYETE